MKHALVDDQLIPATPDAPATASCPKCGSVVKLRNRQGAWFWRHAHLPQGGCSLHYAPYAVLSAAEESGSTMRNQGAAGDW